MKCVHDEECYCGCLHLRPGWDSWQVVMAGRVIAVDIMWMREQPGHHAKEDNAAAFQVLVAPGDCVGALEVQVFVAGGARAAA